MGAHVDQLPRLHDRYPVGDGQRRQAVGYQEGRAAFDELLERLLDEGLRLFVQGTGGFVEDEDPGEIGRASCRERVLVTV